MLRKSYCYTLLLVLLIAFVRQCICWNGHVLKSGQVGFIPGATERQQKSSARRTSSTDLFSSTSDSNIAYSSASQKQMSSRDNQICRMLQLARRTGPVGSFASTSDQEMVKESAMALQQLSEPRPARVELTGVHTLVYSSATGPSSGRIGPWAGLVTQTFLDPITYVNAVELGPLRITLSASRQVIDDETIQVTFHTTNVELFGNHILQTKSNGGGIWKVVFVGTVTDEFGISKFIRVMETPSIFVLEQEIAAN